MKMYDTTTVNGEEESSSGASVRKTQFDKVGRPFVKKVVDTRLLNSVLERFEQKSDSEDLPNALFGKRI